MASTENGESFFEEDKKIPVFTVLKNGSILKNIFVINRHPPPAVAAGNSERPCEDYEEILTVGRHPDCNIMLTHPSISRFHLQINSKPSSQNLSVMDLSSVHGSWVSDRRIEPGARVDLKEGDTLRIGGSTRVYRLHWIPLNQAYDMDRPFVPKLNESLKEDENMLLKDENSVFDENNDSEEKTLTLEQKEETCQESDHFSVENSNSSKELSVIEWKDDNTCQERNSLSTEESVPLIKEEKDDGTLRGINSLFSLDNSEVAVQNENASAPSMPENLKTSSFNQEWNVIPGNGLEFTETENLWCGPALTGLMDFLRPVGGIWETGDQKILSEFATEGVSRTEHTELPETIDERYNLLINLDSITSMDEEKGNQEAEIPEEAISESLLRESLKDASHLGTESLTTFLSVDDLSDAKFCEESQSPESHMVCQPSSTMINTESPKTERKFNSFIDPLEACLGENEQGPAAALLLEEMENKVLSRNIPEEFISPGSFCLATESVSSSQPVEHALLDITDVKFNKENQKTPQSRFAAEELSRSGNTRSPTVKSEKIPSGIWSRRGKSCNALQVQTDKSRRKIKKTNVTAEDEVQNDDVENRSITKALFHSVDGDGEEVFTPDKENLTPNTLLLKSLKKKGMLDGDEKEVFTPDKENLTPNTLLLKSLKKKGMLEEVKHPNSNKSCSSDVNPDEDILSASDKENQTPKILMEKKPAKAVSINQARLEKEIMVTKKTTERVPFQCIHVNSASKSKSQTSVHNSSLRKRNTINSSLAMENINTTSSDNTFGKGKKSWKMVVDTTTLLNKESMKSLKLLQGLKGTHLVIPRMVIWELGCLKQRGYLFRSNAEAASALEWIEECMSETKWWIHIQNSVEGRFMAKTPPASPQPTCASSGMLSANASLMEVLSPTAEDHIVECAILLQKMNYDGHLVLLSTDTNTKIKAMAEGLICETAEEFRESVVNPFSDRFLWADSSPRGQTWSHLDDVVLREKYQDFSTKKTWKGEGAKGLKLILQHNSHYGYK